MTTATATQTIRHNGRRVTSGFVYVRTANGTEYTQELTATQATSSASVVLADAMAACTGKVAEAFVAVRCAGKSGAAGVYEVVKRA